MSNIVTDPQNSYRSAAGKRVGNEILDTFNGPVGMALFLLSQASEITSMTSTASRKISSNNVVGSQRKTLPEIKAGVTITHCEVFGSSRRRSISQVMNYQSGHSGRNYWNLFQILTEAGAYPQLPTQLIFFWLFSNLYSNLIWSFWVVPQKKI